MPYAPEKNVLFEGSQGSYLDIEFGTYPYVTSSSTTVGGVFTGTGVPPGALHRVVGVAKAYTTRVGNGPFPTELHGAEAKELRERGNEFGATTGRPRRVGHLDLVLLRYAVMLNGVSEIILTKVDVLAGMDKVRVAVAYRCGEKEYRYPPPTLADCEPVYVELKGWKDLKDPNLGRFLQFVEMETKTRISYVSYGPKRDEMIKR
ncbi:MAG: adenylosuccinate synthetase [Euryarchaeota archaeon]|nr:adenylosuccinate synthetase [Euryarchaeota archaeon]